MPNGRVPCRQIRPYGDSDIAYPHTTRRPNRPAWRNSATTAASSAAVVISR